MFTLIIHFTGVWSAIYPFLDWQNNAGVAAAYAVGFGLGGGLVGQLVLFSLYKMRLAVFKSCCGGCGGDKSTEDAGKVAADSAEAVYTNEAFRL